MRSGEQWCLTHVFELISISVPFLDPHPLPSRCYCRADSRTYEKGTLISRGRFFLTDHSRFSIFNPSRSRFLSLLYHSLHSESGMAEIILTGIGSTQSRTPPGFRREGLANIASPVKGGVYRCQARVRLQRC